MILYFISVVVCFAVAVPVCVFMDAQSKKPAKAAKQPQKASQARQEEKRQRAEEQRRQKVAQAQQDLPFYEVQLERLYTTADQLNHQYKTAVENLRIDAELNRITDGKAVKAKIVEQHIAARDDTMKKLIAIETRIHAMEAKKAKAEAILTD